MLNQNVLSLLQQSAHPSVFDASFVNGEAVRTRWTIEVVNSLQPIVQRVIQKVNDVVQLAIMDNNQIRKLVSSGLPSVSEGATLLRELHRFKFNRHVQLVLNDDIKAICESLLQASNAIFVTSSVRIVEGLNQQLRNSDKLDGIEVSLDLDEKLTLAKLGVRGLPVMDYVRLTLASIFSESWMIANVSQAFASESTFDLFVERVQMLTNARTQLLTRELKRIVFYIAQEALFRANKQLAAIKVSAV